MFTNLYLTSFTIYRSTCSCTHNYSRLPIHAFISTSIPLPYPFISSLHSQTVHSSVYSFTSLCVFLWFFLLVCLFFSFALSVQSVTRHVSSLSAQSIIHTFIFSFVLQSHTHPCTSLTHPFLIAHIFLSMFALEYTFAQIIHPFIYSQGYVHSFNHLRAYSFISSTCSLPQSFNCMLT